jgi:hypothetical protein
LRHDRVAGGQRGGGHAERDGDREVPRGDDRADAARDVGQLVALAGRLQQRRAVLLQVDGGAGVVLEEVDRLADVGVGLRPGLGALAYGQRREPRPVGAQDRRGAHEDLRPPGDRRLAPAAERRLGELDRRVRLRAGRARGQGDDAVGRARVGGDELVAVAALVADPHRHPHRQRRVERAHRLEQPLARRGAAQLEDGLVDERLHGAASSLSSDAPEACSLRNDSLLVFSSRRRTR